MGLVRSHKHGSKQLMLQASQSAGGQSFIIQLLPLILIFVVFIFLLIRPQQKRVKQHRNGNKS